MLNSSARQDTTLARCLTLSRRCAAALPRRPCEGQASIGTWCALMPSLLQLLSVPGKHGQRALHLPRKRVRIQKWVVPADAPTNRFGRKGADGSRILSPGPGNPAVPMISWTCPAATHPSSLLLDEA